MVAWRRLGAAALVTGIVGAAADARAEGAALGMDEAIRLALTRNERAKVADLQVDVADAAVERARAGFLPTIIMQGNATQRPYEITQQGRTTVPYNSGSSSLSFNQPIVNVPAWPIYRQAQRLLDAQKFLSAEDKRTLGFDAARAFIVVLSEQQILQAALRRVELAKAGLADMEARAAAQLASTNDVTRAQLELASADKEVENDRGLLEKAMLQLAFVLNTKIQGELVPPAPTLKASEQTVGSADPLVAAALPRRMDLLATRHRMIAARIFATEPMYRLIPTLGFGAQLRAAPEAGTVSRWDDETFSLTLSWTIYDAGVRYADKRSREAQATIAELDLQTLQRSVETQVRVAAAALASTQAGYRYAITAVAAARKSVEETAILYRQGLARAIEVTDASGSRFVAEVNLAVAQFGMAQAYLDLRFAMGLDPLGTDLR